MRCTSICPTARSVHRSGAAAGRQLTPKHYAYLKISEAATIAVLSASSRRCAAFWSVARCTKCCAKPTIWSKSGVRELLVVSRDTSAYGVDVKYRTGFHDGETGQDIPMTRLVQALGNTGARLPAALCLPVSRTSMSDPVDGRRQGAAALDIPVPARQPEGC